MATREEMPATDLEPLAQRYVTVHLSESTFKSLSSLLEDWIIGLVRLWLTAYPPQLAAAYTRRQTDLARSGERRSRSPCLKSWRAQTVPRFWRVSSNESCAVGVPQAFALVSVPR